MGWYMLAITPLLASAWWWIACVASGDRSAMGLASGGLTAAMLWRWGWLAKVQQVVMRDMGMPTVSLDISRVSHIVLVKLVANVGMSWGSLLILPGLWCFYVSSFIAPATLSPDRHENSAMRYSITLVAHHLGLLARHGALLSLFVLMALIAAGVAQAFMINDIMPSLMGVDSADASISMSNVSWILFSILVVLLLFDLYWSVGAVLLKQQLEARRTGSDLMARLVVLRDAES